jgi:ABC-type multidrug transport system fused ATPase/permease subunit
LEPLVQETLPLPDTNFVGEVELSHVSYSFQDSDVDLISDLSLLIEPGEFVAITGESGSGKTTLIDILLGLRKPSSGKVEISNLEPTAAISQWPGAIAYVPQEVFVSGKSLKENIGLGLPPHEISDDLVWETLKQVQLDSWARGLPQGLGSPLGDFGSKISGGQRQRIGIARALYSRPHLLVLDEATSSLDSNTEAKISELLRNLGKEVTVLVIAHRLSSIQSADRVVFLKKGQITGVGTFNELRSMNNDFDSLCKSLEIV